MGAAAQPDRRAGAEPALSTSAPPAGHRATPRAFRVLVRNALFRRVELAALRRYDELGELDARGRLGRATPGRDALEPYFDEHDEIGTGPDARGPALLLIDDRPRPLDGPADLRRPGRRPRLGHQRRGRPGRVRRARRRRPSPSPPSIDSESLAVRGWRGADTKESVTTNTIVTIIAAVLIALSVVGVLVPLVPGPVLGWAGVLIWALFADGGEIKWIVFSVVTAIALVGVVVKFAVPTRNLHRTGVPARSIVVGAVFGIIGFFLIPFLGLPIGVVLGVFLAELVRLSQTRLAWQSTKSALKAVGVGIIIELFCAMLHRPGLGVRRLRRLRSFAADVGGLAGSPLWSCPAICATPWTPRSPGAPRGPRWSGSSPSTGPRCRPQHRSWPRWATSPPTRPTGCPQRMPRSARYWRRCGARHLSLPHVPSSTWAAERVPRPGRRPPSSQRSRM